MGECMSELAVEGLAVLIVPSVHRAGFVFREVEVDRVECG
jgi:hypothetical protein